ncbi:MAG: alpha-2-macroglobulin family protein, partial [Alphaproteobacteria bacterium]
PTTASTGTWRLAAYADPKKPAIGNAAILVEDYTPERMEMTITPAKKELAASAPTDVKVEGRYLYGAPASNLVLEGELIVKPRKSSLKGYKDYVFGLETDQFAPNRTPLEKLPTTDAKGVAQLNIKLPEMPQTSKLLSAQLDLRLRDPSGRVLARNTQLDVRPSKPFVGLKPAFKAGETSEGMPAEFDIVVLDPDGKPAAAKGLTWELTKIESRFQWYKSNGSWEFQHIKYQRKIANGTLDAAADKPARLNIPIKGWGKFRLEIASASGKITPASTSFSSGWYASEAGDTPDVLDLALDKASYKSGDTVNVQLSPRMAGKAMVAVVSNKLVELKTVDVPKSGASVSFTVGDDWGPGTYVMAELYRPMDTEAKRMPGRAVGVKWLSLDNTERTLNVALELPERTRPKAPLSVPVTVSGLKSGEKAHITVAAVDLGILNLTNYPVPKPDHYFYGQRRLGMELRDLYGKLIDGMQGTRGTIRSGGDGSGMRGGALPTTIKPVALYSGIVEVDASGKAAVKFDIPAYDGTLRVMAVAWNAAQVGHGTKDIIVRDPVVVQGTPPKFLIIGDKSELHFNIANVEGPDGDYELAATSSEGITVPESAMKQSFKLAAKDRKDVVLPLSADNLGKNSVTVALTGPDGISIERSYDIPVTPAAPNISRRTTQKLAANTGKLSVTKDLVADLIPGSAKVTVNAGIDASLDVPGLLLALDRYPYGCAEQTVSRALPLLYHNEVAEANGMAGEKGARKRVQAAIERVALMQNSGGSFGLWGPNSYYDMWLTAYVTDFLVRAQEKGYRIPSRMYETALDRLRNSVSNTSDFQNGGEELAYALYVLARSGRAVV